VYSVLGGSIGGDNAGMLIDGEGLDGRSADLSGGCSDREGGSGVLDLAVSVEICLTLFARDIGRAGCGVASPFASLGAPGLVGVP